MTLREFYEANEELPEEDMDAVTSLLPGESYTGGGGAGGLWTITRVGRVQSVRDPAQQGELVELFTRGDGTRIAAVRWEGRAGVSNVRASDIEPATRRQETLIVVPVAPERWCGFLVGMAPLLAGRVDAALSKNMAVRGLLGRTGNHIESLVSDGFRVREGSRGRVLENDMGTFFLQRDFGKIALDYAEFLSSRLGGE